MVFLPSVSNSLNVFLCTGPLVPEKRKRTRKVNCLLTKNMKDNYEHWSARMNEEAVQKAALEAAVEAAAQLTSNVRVSTRSKAT